MAMGDNILFYVPPKAPTVLSQPQQPARRRDLYIANPLPNSTRT